MKRTTTARLEDILRSAQSEPQLKEYLDSITAYQNSLSFSACFALLLEKYGAQRSEVIASSGIERTYGYQLLGGLRKPGRDKVLALCLALGCTVEEACRALICSGAAPLYAKDRRDAVLLFALERRLSVTDTNELLEEFDLPLLG